MRKLTNKPLVYYSYQNYVNVHKINYSKFDGSWIANYSAKPNVTTDLWQYTSHGSLSGISGRVDLSKAVKGSVVNSWLKTSSKDAAKPTYFTSLPSDKKISTSKMFINIKMLISKVGFQRLLQARSFQLNQSPVPMVELIGSNFQTEITSPLIKHT